MRVITGADAPQTPMEAACAPYMRTLEASTYASVVPDRKPVVKFHQRPAGAKAAVALSMSFYLLRRRGARGGEIYERTANGWSLLYRVEEGTASADLPWRR